MVTMHQQDATGPSDGTEHDRAAVAPEEVLARIERYYDTVPRAFAAVEEVGPFTLFVGEPGGWVYYARPRLGGDHRFTAADVAAAADRLGELGLPQDVEWVHETTPSLLEAVRAEGSFTVEEVPLMVLTGDLGTADPAVSATVRLLTVADRDAAAAARAVGEVGFAAAGTQRGTEGSAERDAALRPAQQRVLDLIEAGTVLVAVAEAPEDGVVGTGRAMPVGDVTEIVGVATLPSARRRGIAAALTRILVDAARAAGVRTVFLTASSEPVARIYAGVGFQHVATGYIASRPST